MVQQPQGTADIAQCPRRIYAYLSKDGSLPYPATSTARTENDYETLHSVMKLQACVLWL